MSTRTRSPYSDAQLDRSDHINISEDLFNAGSHGFGAAQVVPQPGDSNDDHEGASCSVLEHADETGLWFDYLAAHLLASQCIPPPPETAADDLDDPPGAVSLGLSDAISAENLTATGEKWQVDKETAALLASVILLPGKQEPSQGSMEDRRLWLRPLKIDEALLSRDHGLELQQIRRRNVVKLDVQGLKSMQLPLDVERNESVHWPSSLLRLPDQLNEEVSRERLDVAEATIHYLRRVAEPATRETDIITECFDCRRVRSQLNGVEAYADQTQTARLRPDTPLMHWSPPSSPPALPSSLMDFEFTSTPEDTDAVQLVKLDQQILEVDESTMPYDVQGHRIKVDESPVQAWVNRTDSELQSAELASYLNTCETPGIFNSLSTPEDCSLSPAPYKSLKNVRAEPPLTPVNSNELTVKEHQTVTDGLESSFPIPQPDSDMSIMDARIASRCFDEFVDSYVQPAAVDAVERIEGEQLSELDTTMRVIAPQLEDIPPTPPWSTYSVADSGQDSLTGQRALLAVTERELPKEVRLWHGSSKLERMLRWSPFPMHLGIVHVEVELDDDKSAVRYMADLATSAEADVTGMICTTEGLRLFDDHESDEEDLALPRFEKEDERDKSLFSKEPILQSPASKVLSTSALAIPNTATVVPSTRLDMQTLLRKRKQELDQTFQHKRSTDNIHLANQEGFGYAFSQGDAKSVNGPGSLGGQQGDVSISNFMRLQGVPARSPRRSIQQLPLTNQLAAPAAVMVQPKHEMAPDVSDVRPVLGPTIEAVQPGTQIIILSTTLANRALVRQLQSTLPSLDFVERDGLQKRLGLCESSAPRRDQEADMTVSPAVGVILTTLPKVKQKPLPGQTSFYGIRERISDVSLRYETLIVLVSDGRQDLSQALDERDCDALAEFMAFAANLDADVQVQLVVGGEDMLVRWLAATVSRHVLPQDQAETLLPDETVWERFLRAAGMNAFAAQAVLNHLDVAERSGREPHDLAAFVRMSAQQRLKHFAGVLGGQRVLRRVNYVLDSAWASAGSGTVGRGWCA